MDGAKGEDYFDWDFKITFSIKVNDEVIKNITDSGAKVVYTGYDKNIYFKEKVI